MSIAATSRIGAGGLFIGFNGDKTFETETGALTDALSAVSWLKEAIG